MRLHALTKIATVTGALAMPLAMAAPAHATAGGTGSAFGISATGPIAVPATPSVTSSAKQPTRKSVAELPDNPLIEARVLTAAAWAGHGRASVADVKVPKIALTARAVTAKCENGNGVSHLTKVVLNGRTLKAGASPNSTLTVGLAQLGSVSVTLNKQVRDANGNLTVTAIELSVPLGPGKTQKISIASVTCGKGGSGGTPTTPPGKPGDTPSQPPAASPTTPPSAAPVPTPVTGDLPVTG